MSSRSWDYHAQGKLAGKWPLRYLIRHTAFHTLDHAWEMEDKDLTNRARGPSAAQSASTADRFTHDRWYADRVQHRSQQLNGLALSGTSASFE
jgi:hypothetical protein